MGLTALCARLQSLALGVTRATLIVGRIEAPTGGRGNQTIQGEAFVTIFRNNLEHSTAQHL
jgi:hypothetical protein